MKTAKENSKYSDIHNHEVIISVYHNSGVLLFGDGFSLIWSNFEVTLFMELIEVSFHKYYYRRPSYNKYSAMHTVSVPLIVSLSVLELPRLLTTVHEYSPITSSIVPLTESVLL